MSTCPNCEELRARLRRCEEALRDALSIMDPGGSTWIDESCSLEAQCCSAEEVEEFRVIHKIRNLLENNQ